VQWWVDDTSKRLLPLVAFLIADIDALVATKYIDYWEFLFMTQRSCP